MKGTLLRKLLRDLRLGLAVVFLLLAAFEALWAKVTDRIAKELVPQLTKFVPMPNLVEILFKQGPGKLLQTLMGGESINLAEVPAMLSVGYVHPLVQAILCVWAIGRAASAIVGEIDRGTMELLLAQPVARYRVVLAHLVVDLITIPLLCLAMWAGTWLGAWLTGMVQLDAPLTSHTSVNPWLFGPALPNVAALLFAVSGYTMWLSARGRFRGPVLGAAVLITLLQFLVNLIGQLWDDVAWLRPFTVFYYYQPQSTILKQRWTIDLSGVWWSGCPAVPGVAVLAAVGLVGYALALNAFCRRDLPAPL
jgi:ABC-2 type transport system permease protein